MHSTPIRQMREQFVTAHDMVTFTMNTLHLKFLQHIADHMRSGDECRNIQHTSIHWACWLFPFSDASITEYMFASRNGNRVHEWVIADGTNEIGRNCFLLYQLLDLNLSTCKLDDSFAPILGKVLAGPSPYRLRFLNLASNNMTTVGARIIFGALACNPCGTLRHLNFSANTKSDSTLGAVVGEMLKTTHYLRVLSLKGLYLQPDDWTAIADGLAQNRGLETLTLYGNHAFQDISSYRKMAAALVRNRTLRHLKIVREDDPSFAYDPLAAAPFISVLNGVGKNSSILSVDGAGAAKHDPILKSLLARNALINKNLVESCITLLCCRKFGVGPCPLNSIPYEVVQMIAQFLYYGTRGDLAWQMS